MNQRAAIKSKMGRYDTMMEQINIRRAELNSRLLRVKSDEAAREEALLKLEESFESITKELGEMNRKQGDMEKELGDIRGVLTGKDQKLRETQSAYHQESSRLELCPI